MRKNLLIVSCLLLSVGSLNAQEVQDDVSAAVQAAHEQFRAWLGSTQEFVGDVHFEEKDVLSLIELWDDFSTLEKEAEEEEDEDDGSNPPDYRTILDDPDYRAWAKEHGLTAEPWLKKSMRILLMVMREQMQLQLEEAEQEMPAQLEMIEAQREELGEEMYQQLKQGFEMSTRMFEEQRKGWSSLPQPSAAEKKVLEKYGEQLMALMNDDGMGEEEY